MPMADRFDFNKTKSDSNDSNDIAPLPDQRELYMPVSQNTDEDDQTNNPMDALNINESPNTSPESINTVKVNEIKGTTSHHPTSINVVLQWLCYTLWEWLLLAVAVLIVATLTYFFIHSASTETSEAVVIYSLVTMVCILPFAFFMDRIYSKRESLQKHGFAAVVMVVNAVVVFLVTVAGLVTAIINVVYHLVNGTASANTAILLVSSIVVTILGAILFLRIVNLEKLSRYTKLFPKIVGMVVIIGLLFAIFGPLKSEISGSRDRLIENNLPNISNDVQNYVETNGYLPASLQDSYLTQNYTQGEKALVNQGLVSYSVISNNPDTSSYNANSGNEDQNDDLTLIYQLCVTYNHKLGNGQNDTGYDDASEGNINTANHSSGYVCYKEYADTD
jgi:hypothetical protein